MGLFTIFRKKQDTAVLHHDFAILHCDMHSHLIPGIDDGAKTLTDSMAMVRRFCEMGYRKLITTPHSMGDFYRNNAQTILPGLELIREQIKHESLPIQLEAAAEYYLDFDFERKLQQNELLSFGNRYLLFEVSYLNPPENLAQAIFNMQAAGYKPVLAHPERYPFWYDKPQQYEELYQQGVLLQVNINSLTGHYSKQAKDLAEWLIKNQMVSFLGSDCHHTGHQQLMQQALRNKALQQLLAADCLLNKTL